MSLRITDTTDQDNTTTTIPGAEAGSVTFVQSGKAIPGPAGPAGPQGPPGHIQFKGHGPPPDVIVGATPGSTYLDLDSKLVYELQG